MTRFKKPLILFLLFFVLASLLLIVDGFYFAPNRLKIHSTTIKSAKVDSQLNGFKVLYFSDLNINEFYDEKRISNLITKINETKPDVVLFGGGLVNQLEKFPLTEEQISFLTQSFNQISAIYGKFAVSGNVDEYSQTTTNQILVSGEFELIDNKLIKLYKNNSFINLIGVGNVFDFKADIAEQLDPSHYTLAFGHQPNHADVLVSTLTDRYIAGNTFGGQLNIPFLNNAFFGKQKYTAQTQKVNNLIVDVSNGVGMKLIDVRLLSDPQINLYIFENK